MYFMALLESPTAFEGYMPDGRRENVLGNMLIFIDNCAIIHVGFREIFVSWKEG